MCRKRGSFGHSFDRFAQLPEILRLVWIAEIQVVRDCKRIRTGTGEIARCFRDRDAPALARIEATVERIAIGRRRQNLVRLANMKDGGVRARLHDRSGANHVIVLAINPILGRDGWIAQEPLQSITADCAIAQIFLPRSSTAESAAEFMASRA